MQDAAWCRSDWPLLEQPLDEIRSATGCDRATEIALDPKNVAIRRTAQTQRLLQNRVEHRREVAGRRIDDLQHLGGRGLPSERLVALDIARVEPLQQLGVGPLEISDNLLRDRLTCCRASRSFADLVGTDLPGGSYRDQHGHHRLLIGTITRSAAK